MRIHDDQIGIVIADVAGKGVPAALLMAFLRASLRAATHIGYAPQISMAKVNYLLWESIERNQFVTAFYGILDATNRTLAYANAGHNPPLLLNADGSARFLEQGSVPLGMFRDTRYYEYYLTIEPGQLLVLYTDGVTEAMNPREEEFGRDRLVNSVKAARDLSAREMIDAIQRDIADWTDGRGAHDDVTFFVIKALQLETGDEPKSDSSPVGILKKLLATLALRSSGRLANYGRGRHPGPKVLGNLQSETRLQILKKRRHQNRRHQDRLPCQLGERR